MSFFEIQIYVKFRYIYCCSNVGEVMDFLSLGNSRRTVEATAVNQVSTRSHAVLQM